MKKKFTVYVKNNADKPHVVNAEELVVVGDVYLFRSKTTKPTTSQQYTSKFDVVFSIPVGEVSYIDGRS